MMKDKDKQMFESVVIRSPKKSKEIKQALNSNESAFTKVKPDIDNLKEKEIIKQVFDKRQICKHFDEEVCSKLDCRKDCKYYGKANCKTCIHEEICQLRTFSYCEEEVKEKGCEHYQPKFPEDSVVVSKKEIKIYQEIYDFMKEKGLVSVGEMKTLISFVLKGSMLKNHIVKETAEKILEVCVSPSLRQWIFENFIENKE